ncbi:uncharacterized protein ACRADG_000977 [Cochliomyia hominivorax]
MKRICNEIEILYKILKYLNLKDLLNAAKACKAFRRIIIEYILKTDYKEVEICEIDNFYIIGNKVEKAKLLQCNDIETDISELENKIILNGNDVEEFLNLQANNIQLLKLRYDGKERKNTFLTKFKFHNLKELHCSDIRWTIEILENVQQNCVKIRKISLSNCLDENILYSRLSTLPSLKSLSISSKKQLYVNFIENLIKQMKLETCTIDSKIVNKYTEKSNLTIESVKLESYKELNIGEIDCEVAFRIIHSTILTNLPQLTKLKLTSTNSFLLTSDFFKTLNKFCNNLRFLCLERFNIKEFTPLLSLEKLELRYCNGLTWQDLKTLLNTMSLQTFISYATRYPGTFENFEIALSLRHLSLQYNIVNNFKNLFSMNEERLKNIYSLNWSVDHAKQLWINPKNCPNLEMLMVKPRNLLFENLHDFKFLKILILNLDSGDFKTDDIIKVLKHPTIIHFQMKVNNYNCILNTTTDRKNFETNIRLISLNYHTTLISHLEFWFSLLKKNVKFILKVYGIMESLDLETVLSNQYFPTHFKSINICGFTIDATELRCNFTNVFTQANLVFENKRLQGEETFVQCSV